MDLVKESHLTPELLAEIRRLHFETKRMVTDSLMGSYRSAFRGHGIEFEEVREYVPGDDIRSIDWKVTARSNKPFVKSYREERELDVVIVVDVSASTFTGTRSALRSRTLALVGGVLSLVALYNNDKVGLVTFSNRLETFHPPKKSRASVWRILHEVLNPGVYSAGTDIAGLLRFLNDVLKRNSVVFLLSDFLNQGSIDELRRTAKRFDLTAVRVTDPSELSLPKVGLVRVRDPETGVEYEMDTSDKRLRLNYETAVSAQRTSFDQYCLQSGIGIIDVVTNEPFFDPLRKHFRERELRRKR